MKQTIIFALLALFLTSCNYIKLGEVAEIPFGGTAQLQDDNLMITFSGINDSRCPDGVQCPTAGLATATFDLVKGNANSTINLEVQGGCMDETGPCGSEVMAMNYRFQLLYLSPYPKKDVPFNEEDYVAKIVVFSLED